MNRGMTRMTEMTIPIKIKTFQNILEYMEKLSYLSYLSLSHILFCRQSLKTTGGFNNDRNSNYNFFYSRFLFGVYRMTRGRHTPPGFGSSGRGGTLSRAMSHPPSFPARKGKNQLVNISICQVDRTTKPRESVGVSGVNL